MAFRKKHGVQGGAGPLALDSAIMPLLNALIKLFFNRLDLDTAVPGLTDGTTDGKIKTAADVNMMVGGIANVLAATDDLWDLTAEEDLAVLEYRAYLLLVDGADAATIAAGSDMPTAARALDSAMAQIPEDKCVVGVYVAGPETDFDGAAGLAAQGTLYDGVPAELLPLLYMSR